MEKVDFSQTLIESDWNPKICAVLEYKYCWTTVKALDCGKNGCKYVNLQQ